MKHYDIFQPTDGDVDALVKNYPLAQIISSVSGSMTATPIPLLLTRNADGSVDLLGHLSKANPQVAELGGGVRVLVVFSGPDAYISPSWYRDRSKAPTWNYATVQFVATAEIFDNVESGHQALSALAAAMEKSHARPWTTAEMAGYEKALRGIATFKAKVVEMRARFKLGQNDEIWKLQDSISGLDANGKVGMASMMRLANQKRLHD